MSNRQLESDIELGRYARYYFRPTGANGYVAYRASRAAIGQFGHRQIEEAIEAVAGHETGAVRHYNVDAIRLDVFTEQLLVVRSMLSGEIIALTETEYHRELGWPLPSAHNRVE